MKHEIVLSEENETLLKECATKIGVTENDFAEILIAFGLNRVLDVKNGLVDKVKKLHETLAMCDPREDGECQFCGAVAGQYHSDDCDYYVLTKEW